MERFQGREGDEKQCLVICRHTEGVLCVFSFARASTAEGKSVRPPCTLRGCFFCLEAAGVVILAV